MAMPISASDIPIEVVIGDGVWNDGRHDGVDSCSSVVITLAALYCVVLQATEEFVFGNV